MEKEAIKKKPAYMEQAFEAGRALATSV
jgi:hypothetical protein